VPPSDQELIDECLKGQTQSFGQLVLRYQDRLYNMLTNLLGSREDAREVAQEAFISSFQKLHTFGGRSAFYSWLFRIALNSAMSRKRKKRRVPVSIDTIREQTGTEPSDRRLDNHPGYSMELSERQAAVRAALADLPEEFRTVLVLKEMEDLKYEEIAEMLDCPIGTVRSRIHRARAEMRSRLTGIIEAPSEVRKN